MKTAAVIVEGLTFSESPRWRDGRIWFSDLYAHLVWSAREDGSDHRVEFDLGGVPAGMGWLPDGRLVVIVQDQARIMRRELDGRLVQHADLSHHTVNLPNDMVITSDGTAYLGCFGFDLYVAEPMVAAAPIMRVTLEGEVSIVAEGLFFPNGMTIIDERTLVVAESFANRLSQFEILPNGDLAERRDWATFGAVPTVTRLADRFGETVVAADGVSSVDQEGAIWVADFTKQHANRVMPGGKVVDRVSTGDLNCFAVELGGEDGRTLFLCATPSELDPEIRKNDPRSTIMSTRVDVPRA